MSNSKKRQKIKEDELFYSKNNGKDVKYLIRLQEEQEAEQEIKEYEHFSNLDQIPANTEEKPRRPV